MNTEYVLIDHTTDRPDTIHPTIQHALDEASARGLMVDGYTIVPKDEYAPGEVTVEGDGKIRVVPAERVLREVVEEGP